MRIHSTPRYVRFDPWQAQNGPGRKTRLRPSRRTIGVFDSGETFDVTDDWRSREPADNELPEAGLGAAYFLWIEATPETLVLINVDRGRLSQMSKVAPEFRGQTRMTAFYMRDVSRGGGCGG